MATTSRKKRLVRYILMPAEGFTGKELTEGRFQPSAATVSVAARRVGIAQPAMRVIDTIHENGPKLVEMPPEGELSLRLSAPGVRIVPEVFYQPAVARPEVLSRPEGVARAVAATAAAVEVEVVDAATGAPLEGATIIAFTDFTNRLGEGATTRANGKARFRYIAAGQRLERVYLYPPHNYWGRFRRNTTLGSLGQLKLRRIDLGDSKLLLKQLYGSIPRTAGANTVIGIIDTGIDASHPDLSNVIGGLNCVTDETQADPGASANWRPALVDGDHGTHVAGIAAGRGRRFRGVAPAADLRAYRVFPDVGGGASNYDIAKAIDAAVADGCNVLNLSLGGPAVDPLTQAAIDRALNAGAVVVAAAGNDGRQPVSYPAGFPQCVAVTALGRRGSFPGNSLGTAEIASPYGGARRRDFLAAFSNIGAEIDVTGPGVEIVSTVPGGGYAAMNGTSMATPAIAGVCAWLLSIGADIRALTGAARSRKLKDTLYSRSRPVGFGREYEGFGLPK